jgi:hypothetical protein
MNSPGSYGILGLVAYFSLKHCRNCNRTLSPRSAFKSALNIPGVGHFCDEACLEDWMDASVW